MLLIHIGLPRTGSGPPFFKHEIFPKWSSLCHIRTPALLELVAMQRDRGTYLISQEGLTGFSLLGEKVDELPHYGDWRSYIPCLAALLPDARILVGFKQHEEFLVTLYRDYLYAGGTLEFEGFFDVEGDDGLLRKSDLSFRGIIESVEAHFKHPPFIFLQEDFVADPERFFVDLEAFVGAQPPALEELNLAPRNDVGHYQARLLRWLNGLTRSWHNPRGLLPLSNRYSILLRVDPRRICQDWLAFLSRRPLLLPSGAVNAIRDHYGDDWAFATSRARQSNGAAVDPEASRTATVGTSGAGAAG